jgi:hypothetical protein
METELLDGDENDPLLSVDDDTESDNDEDFSEPSELLIKLIHICLRG